MRFNLPNATDGELVPSSKGERMLDSLIEKHPILGQYAYWKDTIILFNSKDYKITTAYLLTKAEVEQASNQVKHPFTIPDRLFLYNDIHFAVYVDGPSHLTPNGSKKDDEINEMLESRGIKVLRLDYTITKTGVHDMLVAVERFMLSEGS